MEKKKKKKPSYDPLEARPQSNLATSVVLRYVNQNSKHLNFAPVVYRKTTQLINTQQMTLVGPTNCYG